MKIRCGFISNSSSSSFIISSKEDAGDIDVSLTLTVRLRDLTENTIINKKDLIAHYEDYAGYTTEKEILQDQQISDEYKRCLKELENGKKIYIVTISNEGSPLEAALYDQGDPKFPTSPYYEVISR
jgi:hypothetical protein